MSIFDIEDYCPTCKDIHRISINCDKKKKKYPKLEEILPKIYAKMAEMDRKNKKRLTYNNETKIT